MEKEQVISFLKENEGFLKENGFQTEVTVEKEVIKPAEVTNEVVESFIEGNQGFRDKLYNNNVGKYLKKQLGVEEVTPEMLGEKIVLSKNLDKVKNTAKESAIKLALKDAKHPELILSQFDREKITFDDNGITGIEDQMADLKTKYPDLFGSKGTPTPPGTPPALPRGGTPGKYKTREEIDKMDNKTRMQYKKDNPDWHQHI